MSPGKLAPININEQKRGKIHFFQYELHNTPKAKFFLYNTL